MALSTVWDVGYKCHICYSHYEISVSTQSAEHRQRVVESCADHFFSEITGDEFDWNLIICNQVMPFCLDCWTTMEKIHELIQQKENTENSIEELVKNWSSKVLSNRKYLKKKGVTSSVSDPNANPLGEGIKIEGFSLNQNANIKCKMCHNTFIFGDPTEFISLDITAKVAENCEKHLFPELIEEGFYDWNSIPFNNFVPLCVSCSQDMKKIMEWDEKLTEVEDVISDNIDLFTLKVLKCRKALKRMGRRGNARNGGFRDDRSVASADSLDSQDSQDTVFDVEEDCQIINGDNHQADVYPTNFSQITFQQPPLQFVEQENPMPPIIPCSSPQLGDEPQVENSVPMTTESFSMLNENHSFEDNMMRPNSAETCVVPVQVSNYSPRSTSAVKKESVSRPEMAGALKPPPGIKLIKTGGSGKQNMDFGLLRPRVTIARLSIKNSGTLFKCQNCGKIFIFRKCWEQHASECPKGNQSGFPPKKFEKSCCGQSFASEDNWKKHLLQHSNSKNNPSQTRLNSKSLPNPIFKAATPKQNHNKTVEVRSNRTPEARTNRRYSSEDPVEFHCDFCVKRCLTKRGLNLHMQSHTNPKSYKCRKCPSAFPYANSLKAHYRNCHPHSKETETISPPKAMPKLAPQLKAQVGSIQYVVDKNGNKNSGKKLFHNYRCAFCKTPMEGPKQLVAHIQQHYSVAVGRRCEICRKVFNRPDSCRNHNKTFHT